MESTIGRRDSRDTIPEDEAAALREAGHGTTYGKCGHRIKSCGCHDDWPQLSKVADVLCRACAAQVPAPAAGLEQA